MWRLILSVFWAVCLIKCTDSENSFPFDCPDVKISDNTKRAEFKDSNFGISIPENWAQEHEINRDNTDNLVCLDTSMLFDENRIRSITLTTVYEKIAEPDHYLKIEVNKMQDNYQVIRKGYKRINGHKSFWVLLKDKEMYNMIYYIFREKTYLINVACSTSNSYEHCFCELTEYVNTLSTGIR